MYTKITQRQRTTYTKNNNNKAQKNMKCVKIIQRQSATIRRNNTETQQRLKCIKIKQSVTGSKKKQ